METNIAALLAKYRLGQELSGDERWRLLTWFARTDSEPPFHHMLSVSRPSADLVKYYVQNSTSAEIQKAVETAARKVMGKAIDWRPSACGDGLC